MNIEMWQSNDIKSSLFDVWDCRSSAAVKYFGAAYHFFALNNYWIEKWISYIWLFHISSEDGNVGRHITYIIILYANN